VIALLALIVVVLLIDYFDDKIRSPEDFAKLTTVPLLAPIAHAARSDGGLESMQHPPTVAGEQYRAARTILTRGPEQAGKVLLVAGPASGDGRTTVAANLAAVFGAVGRRVVAVDADLRRPALHELFRVGNSAGLSTVLGAAESSTDDIIHETLTERVSLITAGPETSNPSELLDSSRMRDLLDDVRARSDIVIIDSPPALEVADASILASAADAILLVVREGHTRSGDLIATVDELRRYGAPIVGALLNDSGSNRRRTVRPGGSDEAQAVAVESGSRHAAGQAVESGDIASSS
jgi:capsular exopolysaccharide synthesis family protein